MDQPPREDCGYRNTYNRADDLIPFEDSEGLARNRWADDFDARRRRGPFAGVEPGDYKVFAWTTIAVSSGLC